VKLRAAAGQDPHWLLELAYPPLDHVQLFTPSPQGGWQRQVAGDLEPFSHRAVAHRNHVLPVVLPAGQATALYLRLTTEGTMAAPLRLWRAEALWKNDQASYALLSLYFGLLIGLFLYNLLLFVSVRDRAYLVYVLFVAGMAVGSGGADRPGLTSSSGPTRCGGTACRRPVGTVHGRGVRALVRRAVPGKPRRHAGDGPASCSRSPRLWGATLARRPSPCLRGVHLAGDAAGAGQPWFALMVSGRAGAASAARVPARALPGRVGGCCWSGVLTLFLHNTGVLPSNGLTSNALLIGSGLEMVLLSFALADRINVARRFREQAQARIAAEHAMVEALSESEQRLKTVLEEREIVLDNSIVGICFLTREGRLRWANRAMLEMFGAAASRCSRWSRSTSRARIPASGRRSGAGRRARRGVPARDADAAPGRQPSVDPAVRQGR
jgi:hypothetical protein